MTPKLSIVVVVMIALGAVVRAQVQPAPTKPPEETGTISGRVVNESGQPVAGAALFARAMNSVSTTRSTSTDADGSFRLNGLEPSLYNISANAAAYATDSTATTNYYRLGDSVRLELVRGGVITGTVTNGSNDPVIGVRVRAIRIRDARGQTPRLPAFSFNERLTDDRGNYRIYGLLPGSYLVSAGGGGGFSPVFNPYDNDVPTYSPSALRDNAAEISVSSGEETTADIRYRGEPGHGISGTVRASGTNGASVTLRPIGNSIPVATSFQPTGGRGFAFTGLGDGDYLVKAQEVVSGQATNTPQFAASVAKRVTIKGANVTGVELIPLPMASISGRVVLEPLKIPACEGKHAPLFTETLVQLQRSEKEAEEEDGPFASFTGGSAAPDATGALLWRNVRPGKYGFEPRFYARYWYLQSITINTNAPKPQKIDAAANWTAVKSGEQLAKVIVTLAEGAASIRGRLPVAEGAAIQSGTVFYLIPAEPDKATDVLRFFVTDVAADGTFTFNSLPPGKYLGLAQTNVDGQIATLVKLREPETEAVAARAKLRRSAEAKKTEIELKPCQNLTDYQLKQ